MKCGAATLLVAVACSTASPPPDVGLEGLALASVAPGVIVPGTRLSIEGDSFVDASWGATVLRLAGTAGGAAVDLRWPAVFDDFDHLHVDVTAAMLDEIGGDVEFVGDATIEVTSTVDDELYASAPRAQTLAFRRVLTPTVTAVQTGTLTFLNDAIEIEGDGFLLGGGEGQTVARLTGCFTLSSGGGCAPIAAIEVPMTPASAFSRTRATFPFLPTIAGIQPGGFLGEVVVENQPAAGATTAAAAEAVDYELIAPAVFAFSPTAASLGQYVFAQGGGFLGGAGGGTTELRLVGTFAQNGGDPEPVDLTLIPDFVAGPTVKYVVNEDDALGQSLDLRSDTGDFVGTVTPIVSFGGDEVTGEPTDVVLSIAPVKQVVHLVYATSFVEALRVFGLRAVDGLIRARIKAVVERAYPAVNLEVRDEEPTDFALFSRVELLGADPNGMALFGYDNSPGKDNNNVRLYDRLGGVNAQTQMDGYPGFGGVFIESLMGFSLHPLGDIESIPGADPTFDEIMDPFRPDQGGAVITAADLSGGVSVPTDGAACPASDRAGRIGCAVYVLGNLIGGTLAHEIGHSLGLANPNQEGFHNGGDKPNRLMDSGGDRPFLERAELLGFGPGVFCDEEYAYLRSILPSDLPADPSPRPDCF